VHIDNLAQEASRTRFSHRVCFQPVHDLFKTASEDHAPKRLAARHSGTSTPLRTHCENPELVRQRLGHASVKTTMALYVHALPEDMRRSADRLAAMIDQA
jgi:integrase